MAKKQDVDTKEPTIKEFVEAKIARCEANILKNNGMAVHDFDMLERYIKLKQYYDAKEAKP